MIYLKVCSENEMETPHKSAGWIKWIAMNESV